MNGIQAANGATIETEVDTALAGLDGECDAWLVPSADESGELTELEICLVAAGS